MEKKPILDDVEKAREVTKTVNPAQCRTLNMPDESLTPTSKVFQLTFPFMHIFLLHACQ